MGEYVEEFWLDMAGTPDYPRGEIERRVPADLNPWAGCAVLALHSRTADEPCTDTCTEYAR